MVYTYCTGISGAGETEGRSTVCRSVDSSGLRLLEFLADNENGEDSSVGDDRSLLPIPKYELLIGERGSGGGKNPAILNRSCCVCGVWAEQRERKQGEKGWGVSTDISQRMREHHEFFFIVILFFLFIKIKDKLWKSSNILAFPTQFMLE